MANVNRRPDNEGVGQVNWSGLTAPEPIQLHSLVRLPKLLLLTGLSRATAYRYSKSDPHFPKPVKLSDSKARNAPVGYRMQDIQNWIAQRAESSGL